MNKNTLLYAGLIIFGLLGAFIFPAYKLQLSFLYILIVLAMTWDVQGGQMYIPIPKNKILPKVL